MSKAKWPSGVPVFEANSEGPFGGAFVVFATGLVDSKWSDLGRAMFYDPECECGEFFCLEWPLEKMTPLNPDAAAMLAIAKESK